MSSTPIALLGDVVGSRGAVDRPDLHRRLSEALAVSNDRWATDLRVTVGDEYQGTVPGLGPATAITLALRLALLPDHDVRHGLGRGSTAVLDAGAGIEDGPGWWAAREAIEAVKRRAERAATRRARTAFRVAAGLDEPTAAVDAALLARDELVGGYDARSLSVLRGLMAGRTQREVAEAEQITPSAVSQRVRRDGIGVVVTMTDWLAGLP